MDLPKWLDLRDYWGRAQQLDVDTAWRYVSWAAVILVGFAILGRIADTITVARPVVALVRWLLKWLVGMPLKWTVGKPLLVVVKRGGKKLLVVAIRFAPRRKSGGIDWARLLLATTVFVAVVAGAIWLVPRLPIDGYDWGHLALVAAAFVLVQVAAIWSAPHLVSGGYHSGRFLLVIVPYRIVRASARGLSRPQSNSLTATKPKLLPPPTPKVLPPTTP